jgi:hypothetical protein
MADSLPLRQLLWLYYNALDIPRAIYVLALPPICHYRFGLLLAGMHSGRLFGQQSANSDPTRGNCDIGKHTSYCQAFLLAGQTETVWPVWLAGQAKTSANK